MILTPKPASAATCSYTFPQTVAPNENVPVTVTGINNHQYQAEITLIVGPSIPVTATGTITSNATTTINITAPQNPLDYQLLVKDITGGSPLEVCTPLTGAVLSVMSTQAPGGGSQARLPDSPVAGFTPEGLVGQLVSKILPIILGLGGFATVIIIVISGIQFVTSSGNPEAAAAARGRLIMALVGFALIILAFAITQIIDTIFLGGSGVF